MYKKKRKTCEERREREKESGASNVKKCMIRSVRYDFKNLYALKINVHLNITSYWGVFLIKYYAHTHQKIIYYHF